MGLDMYAFITKESCEGSVDFEVQQATEIHYWRKHPDLHGWMERLYYHKGGKADCFNCVNLALTEDDLDRLEDAIHMSELPATNGFFFDKSDGSEIDDDLRFIRVARKAILFGNLVYYTASW